jgi:hypothetical protein
MDLKKFRPRWAVAMLAGDPEVERRVYLQTWALARLLAWAILDQRPGKRRQEKAGDAPTARKIRTAGAKQAGQLSLGYLMDRQLRRGRTGSNVDIETINTVSIAH